MFKKALKPIVGFSLAFFFANHLIDYLFYLSPYFFTNWSGFALKMKLYLLGYIFAVVMIFRFKYQWRERLDFFRIVVYCLVFLAIFHLLGVGYDYLFYNVIAPNAGVEYTRYALQHFREFIQNADSTLLRDTVEIKRSLESSLQQHQRYAEHGYPLSLLLRGRIKEGLFQGFATALPLGILLRDPISPR
jgi:hypothetical protein